MDFSSGVSLYRSKFLRSSSPKEIYSTLEENYLLVHPLHGIWGGAWKGKEERHFALLVDKDTYCLSWSCDARTSSTRYILGAKFEGRRGGGAETEGHGRTNFLGTTSLSQEDIAKSGTCLRYATKG
jgi:hypothetical protein